MKTNNYKLMAIFALALQLVCCGDRFPARYTLELPKPPEVWLSLLGEPHWRVQWVNPDGEKQTADIPPGKGIAVEIPVTWVNPVTASPYWPTHNLIPGLFKPAGALFPFDVDGSRLRLSWEAGHDTVFYWELALANIEGNMARVPANFDWQRFRELLKSETLREDVRKDPWLVDWCSVAESTIKNTFYSSRLKPETVVNVTITDLDLVGTWYGASPFAEPLSFAEDETPAFPVRSGGNDSDVYVWISEKGILRVSRQAWAFSDWIYGVRK